MSKKLNNTYIFIFLLILNFCAHFFVNVYQIGNTYYWSYVCWIVLLLVSCFKLKKIKFNRKEFYVSLILLGGLLVGSLLGEMYIGDSINNLHISLFMFMAYTTIMVFDLNWKVSRKKLYSIMKTLALLGALSGIYAVIFQYNYFVNLLLRSNVSWNSWLFTSIFGQRNIFGEYCFISSIAALYCYMKSRKKLYLAIITFLGGLIFLTNSRAALLGYLIFIGICVCMNKHNKIIYSFFVIIVLFATLYAIGFDGIKETFAHTTLSGEDSSSVRLSMWKSCIGYLIDKPALLFGFGSGTVGNYLYDLYGFGSSHNAYIDILFNGGIVLLWVFIRSMKISIEYVKKINDNYFKQVLIAAWVAFIIYNCFEAGMMIFASNYFSVTATVLLVFIPKLYYKSQISETIGQIN